MVYGRSKREGQSSSSGLYSPVNRTSLHNGDSFWVKAAQMQDLSHLELLQYTQ